MIFTEWNANPLRKKLNLYGGCGYYRIVKPAQYLMQWYEVDVVGRDLQDFGKTDEDIWGSICRTYDLIWLRHSDNARAIVGLLAFAEYYNVPVIMDLDDNYLAVLPSQPAYEIYHKGSVKNAIVGASLSLVNAVSVSTAPLKEAYQKHIKEVHNVDQKIYVLPNCNDINDWNYPKYERNDDNIVIGWQGSTTHDEDLDIVVPVIRELLEKYKNVYFEVLGGIPREKFDWFLNKFGEVKDRVKIKLGTFAWQGWPELLSRQGWDIGIAPLADNEFNRGKSHIKWMEYSMYQIPCVASKVYPYYKKVPDNFFGVSTIKHEKTGFLCETREDWMFYLEKLIKDKNLRKKVGNNAYNFIKKNWQYKDWIVAWKKVIDSFL